MIDRRRPALSSWRRAAALLALVLGGCWAVVCASATDAQAQNQNRFRKPGESPWLLSGNIGVPSFDFEDTNLDWDLAVGYYGDNFIIGYDTGQTFVNRTQNNINELTIGARQRFVLGGRLGKPDAFRHGLLLETQADFEDRTYSPVDEDGFTGFDSEGNSKAFARSGLVYAYYSPDDPLFSWAFFAGFGALFEFADESNTAEGTNTSSSDASAFLLARGEGQYQWVPGWVTVRGRSELRLYQSSRSTFDFGDGASFDEGVAFEDATGVALDSRVVAKIDNLELLGLSPMAYTELNLNYLSGSSGSEVIFAPAFGIGIVN